MIAQHWRGETVAKYCLMKVQKRSKVHPASFLRNVRELASRWLKFEERREGGGVITYQFRVGFRPFQAMRIKASVRPTAYPSRDVVPRNVAMQQARIENHLLDEVRMGFRSYQDYEVLERSTGALLFFTTCDVASTLLTVLFPPITPQWLN